MARGVAALAIVLLCALVAADVAAASRPSGLPAPGRKMLLVVNVPPPNNGTAVQNMTVVSNGTSAGTHTQRCSAGYDACFSGCMRSYNLDSDAYQMCCGDCNAKYCQ